MVRRKEVVVEEPILMEEVVGLRCSRLVGPKTEEPGIHSRPGEGNHIQVRQVVLRLGPKVERLEAQVACHRTTGVDNHSYCFHHRDRRRMPKEQRHHSSLDEEDSIRLVLRQKEDRAPRA